MRRRVLGLVAGLLVVVAVEAISWAGLHLLEQRARGQVLELFLDRHFEDHVHDDQIVRYAQNWYDPELGWAPTVRSAVHAENLAGTLWMMTFTEDGSRVGPGEGPNPAVIAWGDSFIAGDEVDPGETWEARLSERLGAPVVNRGVSGYGLDQAVLRLERDLASGRRPPVAVLGVFQDDLGRVVNRFRPFVFRGTEHEIGFKPSLRWVDGELLTLPVAWQGQRTDKASVKERALAAANGDRFAESMARLEFPFTWQLVHLALQGRSGASLSEGVWSDDEGQALARLLLERFVQACRSAGARPVVLWIPEPRDLRERRPPPYAAVRDRFREEHPDVGVLDLFTLADFDGERGFVQPWFGHLSPRGHQAVAEALLPLVR